MSRVTIWMGDGYCLPDGKRSAWPNTEEGYRQLTELLALHPNEVVCLEATGEQE